MRAKAQGVLQAQVLWPEEMPSTRRLPHTRLCGEGGTGRRWRSRQQRPLLQRLQRPPAARPSPALLLSAETLAVSAGSAGWQCRQRWQLVLAVSAGSAGTYCWQAVQAVQAVRDGS